MPKALLSSFSHAKGNPELMHIVQCCLSRFFRDYGTTEKINLKKEAKNKREKCPFNCRSNC